MNYRKRAILCIGAMLTGAKGYDSWHIITFFYLLITLICIFPGEIV